MNFLKKNYLYADYFIQFKERKCVTVEHFIYFQKIYSFKAENVILFRERECSFAEHLMLFLKM